MYNFNLTLEDVLDIPGVDPSSITSTSRPLSTRSLAQFLEDGCAKVITIMESAGIEVGPNMDAAAHTKLATVVKLYVKLQACSTLNMVGDTRTLIQEQYDQAMGEITRRPQQLGAAFSPQVTTNLTNHKRSIRWDYTGFGKGNW